MSHSFSKKFLTFNSVLIKVLRSNFSIRKKWIAMLMKKAIIAIPQKNKNNTDIFYLNFLPISAVGVIDGNRQIPRL
jgi:hypothetical protein